MSIKDNRLLKVVAAGAAAIMILGLAATVTRAQRGPGGSARMQGPGGPGGGPGRGMMAGPGLRGGRGGPLGMLGPGMQALELTDAQREQIRGVMESHKAQFEDIGKRLGDARKALHEAITADQVNPDLVREKAAAMGPIQAEEAVLRASVHGEIFQLLTAEQQQKAKALRAEREKRRENRASGMRERRKQIREQTREQIRRYQDAMPIGDPGLV